MRNNWAGLRWMAENCPHLLVITLVAVFVYSIVKVIYEYKKGSK